MRILDAHHHIWIPQQSSPDLGYVWLRDIGSMKPFGDPTPIQRDYPWQEFSTESVEHELVGSVFLQVDGAIAKPVDEVVWANNAIALPQNAFATVGFVDLRQEKAQAVIEMQKQTPSFRGVRQIISYLEDNPELCFANEQLLRNERWCDQFGLLAEHDLSFDLQCYPEQMPEAAEFLAQHSGVPVVIDHCGSPYDQTEVGLARLRHGLATLANLPQVHVKLSGFGMFNTQWNAANTRPVIDIAMETFGHDRVMFGSNFPVDKLMSRYDAVVTHVSECIGSDERVLNNVFEKNARRFYQLTTG